MTESIRRGPVVLSHKEAQQRLLAVLRKNREAALAQVFVNPAPSEASVTALTLHIDRLEAALKEA